MSLITQHLSFETVTGAGPSVLLHVIHLGQGSSYNYDRTSLKVSYYIVTERPEITFLNRSHVPFANLSSRRYGRGSPMYYVDLHYTTLLSANNMVKVDFYFYEFLSNEYRRGFVEMHFGFCELIHKDNFFGAALRQGKFLKPCPYPPGTYHLYNMSIPSVAIPPGFPFAKGRIYMNMSRAGVYIAGGHIDMELKEKLIRPGTS